MSALFQIAKVDQALLMAGEEIKFGAGSATVDERRAALAAALVHLTVARGEIGKARLTLRDPAVIDATEYHEEMALRIRDAAKLGNMPRGRGLHLQADEHEARAKALRALIGATEATEQHTTGA